MFDEPLAKRLNTGKRLVKPSAYASTREQRLSVKGRM